KAREKVPNFRLLKATRGAAEWTSLRSRPAGREEIAAWFELDPDTNLGIVTGAASEGTVVVDVDREIPADVTLPATASVRTSRDRHLYYRSSAPIRCCELGWGELKGEGGYVVAPDSTHETGDRYEWEPSPEEIELADFSTVELKTGAPTLEVR